MSFVSGIHLAMFKGTGLVDLKQLQRQSFLLYLISLPLLSGMLLRWLIPLATDQFVDEFDLSLYYPLIVSALIIVMTPTLMGTVIGFLLLDERDEQTLTALLVTPMPIQIYVFYRIALPSLLSMILTIVGVWITNLVSLGWISLVGISLEAALAAPIVSLLYFCFSENKVQGFGVLKILGALTFSLPIAAYFIETPQQYLWGLFPLYWSAKAFWMACDGSPWLGLPLLVGIGIKLVTLKILMDRFYRVAYL